MEQESNFGGVINHAEEYLKTRYELGKLEATGKASSLIAGMYAGFILMGVLFLILAFAGIGLAYVISEHYFRGYVGFVVVAIIYLVIGIGLYIKREKWLITPMRNMIIKTAFKTEDDE